MATINPASEVELDLVPIDLDTQKGPGEDQAEIATVLSKHSKIRLGAPKCTDWLADLAALGPLPDDVRLRAQAGYAFRHVRPTLTLLPDRGCLFTSAELSIELDALPAGHGKAGGPSAKPLAYDVLPHEVLYKIQEKNSTRTSFEGSSELGKGPAKLIAKIIRETTVERDGERFVRELYGYGANFREVGWRLQAGGRLPLAGDITDLEFTAQVPSGNSLTGRFRIVAEIAIQTAVDRWLTRVFGAAHDGNLLDVVYALDPL